MREKIGNAYAFFVIGVVLIFTLIRLFYGAELSDEAYSVAETYMVSRGALPFVNNWSQIPGYTMLLAPFVKAFTILSGGTDGIFLFFRFFSFAINALTACAVSIILKKYVKNPVILISCSLIYVGASGWDYVGAFRGDNLSINLLAVGVLLIVVSFVEEKENPLWFLLSGILAAFAVLCYPTLIIEYVYYIVAMVFLCVRKRKNFKSIVWFLAGSFVAAVIIVGYLVLNSGFSDIFLGIKYLLNDVTYFQLKNEGGSKAPEYLIGMLKQVIMLLRLSGMCFVLFLVSVFLFFRKCAFKVDISYCAIKKIYLKRIALLSILAGICAYHLLQIWIFKTTDNVSISLYAITIQTLAVPFLWLFIKKEKKLSNYLMGLIWFPSYVWVVVTGIFTYSGMLDRHDLLKNAAYLLGIFAVFAVRDCFFLESPDEEGVIEAKRPRIWLYNSLVSFLPIMLVMAITFTYIFNAYTYVYRDDSIWRLDTVVSKGPYKGMRTTKTRAEGLMELDRVIDEYVDQEDYVLAMDNDPFIYLMSVGRICTPSTWDQALYSYHFDQPDLYYDYFKVTGTEPSKIIYFNYGRDETMSIDVNYRFNEYVLSNFELIYEDRNIFEWNYCGRDIICELLIFDHK